MCCNLQTHVKVIVIIEMIPIVYKLSMTIKKTFTDSHPRETKLIYLPYVVCIVSAILCFVGAIKNNKCMLIPIMISKCFIILFCIVAGIFCVYYGYTTYYYPKSMGPLLIKLALPGVLCVPGLEIYFLIIVLRFYKEISNEILQEECSPGISPEHGVGSHCSHTGQPNDFQKKEEFQIVSTLPKMSSPTTDTFTP
jgi:hypothetical protein